MSTLFFEKLQQQTAPARQRMLAAPVLAACANGSITRHQYIAFLTQAYHHVKHTVPLLMACGGRLPEHYEPLRAPLGTYIKEEMGHHEWILNDISAMNGNAQAVVDNTGEGRVSTAIELMVSYLYHQIDRGNPLALFGMVWVLEGTSVTTGGAMAQFIQQHLNLPDQAMSYLRSHCELDQEHIQFFAQLMDTITDIGDQQVIIDSANIIFGLYGDMLRGLTDAPSVQAA